MSKPRHSGQDKRLKSYLIGAPALGLLGAALCLIVRWLAPEILAEFFPAGASAPPWAAAFVAAALAVGLVSGLYLASRYASSMLPRPMNRRETG